MKMSCHSCEKRTKSIFLAANAGNLLPTSLSLFQKSNQPLEVDIIFPPAPNVDDLTIHTQLADAVIGQTSSL